MGSVQTRYNVFIREMVKADSVEQAMAAYKKAYPTCKKDESARTGVYRLLQDKTILRAIDERKQRREAAIEKAQLEEIERIARRDIASRNQLEAVLSKIALGKQTRLRKFAHYSTDEKKWVYGEVEEMPSETDQVAAADKLFKVKGAYAPLAVKHDADDAFIAILKAIGTSKKESNGVQPGSNTKV
jgi:hypothetical protein